MRQEQERNAVISDDLQTINSIGKAGAERCCAVSVDVDDLDCYVRSYKLENSPPSNAIYTKSVVRFLDLFERLGIKATFFIVGKDTEVAEKKDIVQKISKAGHEIASHTFSHQPKISGLSRAEKEREIIKNEEVLSDIIGKPIYGYRGPGWDINEEIIEILIKRGYRYDSSLFPSLALPLSKLLLRLKNGGAFVTHGDSSYFNHFAPNQPYRPSLKRIWRSSNSEIIEFPITTVPYLRFPFFGGLLSVLGLNVFHMSLNLIRRRLRFINYELHPMELIDVEEDKIDRRFYDLHPGLKIPLKKRIALFEEALLSIGNYYRFLPYIDIVERHFI